MGGSSGYDREVYTSDQSSSAGFHHSAASEKVFVREEVHRDLLAHLRTLICKARESVKWGLDVTGSMGDSAKMIRDKMPMFYGQVDQQGYLEDFAVSFSLICDARHDEVPLQVCDYGQGIALDDQFPLMYLPDGAGGSNGRESYELDAYFYLHRVKFTKRGKYKPFWFTVGDEGPYERVDPRHVEDHIGDELKESMSTKTLFQKLLKVYHGYMLHVPYMQGTRPSEDRQIIADWREVLGPNLIVVSEPKAVVDVAIGVIALTTGKRTLKQYLEELRLREQTAERIAVVKESLRELETVLAKKQPEGDSADPAEPDSEVSLPTEGKGADRKGKGRRL